MLVGATIVICVPARQNTYYIYLLGNVRYSGQQCPVFWAEYRKGPRVRSPLSLRSNIPHRLLLSVPLWETEEAILLGKRGEVGLY